MHAIPRLCKDQTWRLLKQIILDEGIVDPISGTTNWTDVRQFNLMFSTEMGASADATKQDLSASRDSTGYLRKLSRTEDWSYEVAFRYLSDW